MATTATESRGRIRSGFLHALTSDYKALASLVGLLVYGVVRVAYDAFYARLGVFPEAVGLSETTILGRAVLYLALTVSVAAIFGGIWLGAVAALLERRKGRAGAMRWTRALLLVTLLFPCAAVGIVALGPRLRSILADDHLAYFCFQRCKVSGLRPDQVVELRGAAVRFASSHPEYRFVDLGPEWIVVVAVLLLVVAAALALVLTRWPGEGARSSVAVVVPLAAASLAGGLFAPHLLAASDDASNGAHAFVDVHRGFVRWTVFALVFAAVVCGLLAVLSPLVGQRLPKRSPWLIASFVLVVPLLLGFGEPDVPLFLQEEGPVPVLAAVALWVALALITFRLWPHLREGGLSKTAGLGILVALIVSLTLYIAWERGINLAKRAAMGDQILARRFSLLSVRASVVCLEPTSKSDTMPLPRRPYVYLGEAGGMLVLYDFVSDLAQTTPEAFPVRAPAPAFVVRVAHYNPSGSPTERWDCTTPNS